jgi:fructose-1,6-bisphosphatase/inositol monophosphatase family enzyme
MPQSTTPLHILETLLPHLRIAAYYAQHIQARIAALPEKEASGNLFAAALSDADLSIQTAIEVALLGTFPDLHFYGEEYEKTYNTKYLRSLELSPDHYLVTLDPIDGTRFYLDGHDNYQILLGILGWETFEGAIAISPAKNSFDYAIKGKGLHRGTLDQSLEGCRPVKMPSPNPKIFLGWGMDGVRSYLPDNYNIASVMVDYSPEQGSPNVNAILTGEVSGAVIRGGKFIDGALLAFLAQEMGCFVSTLAGTPLPPLHTCKDYAFGGLIIATSKDVQSVIVDAIAQWRATEQ